MITLPITGKSKKEEWKTILAIAKNNGYPIHTINNLRKKLKTKKQKHQQYPIIDQHNNKWVTFTYFSPVIRRKNAVRLTIKKPHYVKFYFIYFVLHRCVTISAMTPDPTSHTDFIL